MEDLISASCDEDLSMSIVLSLWHLDSCLDLSAGQLDGSKCLHCGPGTIRYALA